MSERISIMSKNESSRNTSIDPLLITAWKRTLDIGSVSSNQKEQYTALRTVAIVLSLLTTFFAVLSGLSNILTPAMQWVVGLFVFIPTLAYILGYVIIFMISSQKPDLGSFHKKHPWVYLISNIVISLIIAGIFYSPISIKLAFMFRFIVLTLPILGTAVVLYARNFASSIWIDYRVQAETIRSGIYTYRVQKKMNADADAMEVARNGLLNIIEEASETLAQLPNPIPYLSENKDQDTLIKRIKKGSYDSKALDALSIEDYIKIRAKNQKNWYAKRVKKDHQNLQNYFIMAQGIAVFGAILSGFDMVQLVAITAAITTALSLTSDISMYGATYGLFHMTAVQLEDAVSEWQLLPEESKDAKGIMKFVYKIEGILSNERNAWEKQAKQLQAQAKQSIDNSSLESTDITLEKNAEISITEEVIAAEKNILRVESSSADEIENLPTETNAS